MALSLVPQQTLWLRVSLSNRVIHLLHLFLQDGLPLYGGIYASRDCLHAAIACVAYTVDSWLKEKKRREKEKEKDILEVISFFSLIIIIIISLLFLCLCSYLQSLPCMCNCLFIRVYIFYTCYYLAKTKCKNKKNT